jgi:hypothetical protein
MLQPSNEGWGNSTIGRPQKKETTMKRIILTAALLGGFFALSASEAGAVVCARGVYRAGCAGPRGAVVTHRGYYRRPYHYHGGAVIYR